MANSQNHLAKETSPYLLQHADNPVNWWAWGEAALEQARNEHKPILLSIGHSACHWCHVMAHESFEDKDTAALMNEYFVNIKVDREERPDLDKIYQLSHQVLTGRGGGWPLTIFLMPDDHTPFFAGTYFPPQRHHGLRSFKEILTALHHAFADRQGDIQQQNTLVREQLQSLQSSPSEIVALDEKAMALFSQQLMEQYDTRHGGFTPKPKFPHPFTVERTFRQWFIYGEEQWPLLQAGLNTARQMAKGGLFDHIGGGFYRYSTDELWMIPHFEKMLYDNGQLLALYAWAYQIEPDYYFDCAIRQTAEWTLQEMQSAEGGYYSAQDADSEGEEGKYYTWTPKQVSSVLNEDEAFLFEQSFGLNRRSNFEDTWHLHTFMDIGQLAEKYQHPRSDIQGIIDRSKQRLYRQRSQRIRPATDTKILVSWNALMIRGMYLSARVLNEPRYELSADKALYFIKQSLWSNGRLVATYKDQKAYLNAYLDDYAYLLMAIIEALQNHWDNELYNWSHEIAQSLIHLFEDPNDGGFYFTSHDHEQLILRHKSYNDDAMPSGNGIAAAALQYLGLLSGQTGLLNSVEKSLCATAHRFMQYPVMYCSMLNVLDAYFHSATIIILRGGADQMKAWQALVFKKYLPDLLCFAIDRAIELPIEMGDKEPLDDIVCAYICEGISCQPPITELDEFRHYLDHKSKHRAILTVDQVNTDQH